MTRGNKVLATRAFSRRTLENQCAVGTTKTKVVFHGIVDLHLSGDIGTIIQIALGILVVDVDRWWTGLMLKRQDGEHTLYATRTTQQMTGHGFGGVDHHTVRMLTQSSFDGLGLIDIPQRRGGAMRVQVIDLVGIDVGIL